MLHLSANNDIKLAGSKAALVGQLQKLSAEEEQASRDPELPAPWQQQALIVFCHNVHN